MQSIEERIEKESRKYEPSDGPLSKIGGGFLVGVEMDEPSAKRSKSSPGDEEEMKKRDLIGKLKNMDISYFLFQPFNKANPREPWLNLARMYGPQFAENKGLRGPKEMIGTDPIELRDLGDVKHLSHDVILGITNNFALENYIQNCFNGRQFRGKLTNRDVVVKIWDFDFPVTYFQSLVPMSFSFQLEILLNKNVANHPNMAKLTGFSCETKLALVWDLKLTKTLHTLIPQGCFTWEQRMFVAGQVADAFDFFHDKKIALCNLYSPCISVDEDLNIQLFEFDNCVNLANECIPSVEKGFNARDYKYSSPETIYPPGFKTEWFYATDVYHFGLLLLELTLSQCVANKAWIEQAILQFEKDNLTLPFEPQKEMIFQLAIKCVKIKPTKRLEMAEVVKQFKSIVHLS